MWCSVDTAGIGCVDTVWGIAVLQHLASVSKFSVNLAYSYKSCQFSLHV